MICAVSVGSEITTEIVSSISLISSSFKRIVIFLDFSLTSNTSSPESNPPDISLEVTLPSISNFRFDVVLILPARVTKKSNSEATPDAELSNFVALSPSGPVISYLIGTTVPTL